MLFGLGLPEWITIIALVATIPLTLKLMARASVAYERKTQERARAAEAVEGSSGAGDEIQGEERG